MSGISDNFNMLPDKHRLKKSKDIQKVLRYGEKFDFENLKVFVYKKDPLKSKQNFDSKFLQSYDTEGNFIGINAPLNQKITNNVKYPSKLTVIISAKQGKAHDRNKFKRRIRNLLRTNVMKSENQWIIVSAKSNSKNITNQNLKNELAMFTKPQI